MCCDDESVNEEPESDRYNEGSIIIPEHFRKFYIRNYNLTVEQLEVLDKMINTFSKGMCLRLVMKRYDKLLN